MKKRVIASVVATVAVASCVFTAVACNKENVAVKEDTRQEQTYGGMRITDSLSGGISLLSAELCATEYEAYGVSTLADSAYTLTATITPSNATNKAVDWSIAWSNAASSWAKGKSVGDYVTLAAKTDGALTATLTCKQAFGEKIKITVTSRENSAIKGECVADYAKRITSISSATFAGSTSANGKFTNTFNVTSSDANPITNCSFTPTLSVGTVEDTFTYGYTMSVTKAFIDALTAQGIECSQTANTYFEFTTSGNFGLNAVKTPILVLQGQKRTEFITAMATLGAGTEIGKIKIVATGAHGTYEQLFPIVLDESCTTIAVESLALSDVTL